MTHRDRVVGLTRDQAEALRRAASQPDLFSGDFSDERDRAIYAPLVTLGLLTQEIRPWPANDAFELVHYETTELGKWALRVYDKGALPNRPPGRTT